MATAPIVPFAVTRAWQLAVDYSNPGGIATAPARVGGTDDLAITTDNLDTTYHPFVSWETTDGAQLYMDTLSWDFRTDTVPLAVCLQIRWRTDPAAIAVPPLWNRQWHTVASVTGTSTVLQSTSGGRGSDAIRRLEGCTQPEWTTSRYFWAEADDADPTDNGNWLDGAYVDLSCLTGPGLRMSVLMRSVNEDLPHPTWADIAEGRLIASFGDPGIDVLMQGEMLTQTGARPIYTTGSPAVLGRAATTPAPPTPHTVRVAADWVQRYAGDGTKLTDPDYGTGVSQGVLDRDELGDPTTDGWGHERSLVGFTLTLPDDADIAIVRLQVPWTSWWYANGVGNLVLGWHDNEQAPDTWTAGAGTTQLSTHEARQESLNLPLQWANTPIGSGAFRGLTVGPGLNDGPLYAGSTDVDPSEWVLEIQFLSREDN